MTAATRQKVNMTDVQVGDLMGITVFAKVTKKQNDSLFVKNIWEGMEYEVRGQDLIESMQSADRFNKTEELSKTALAEKLISSYNIPLTVVFEKADGSVRTLRGRFVSTEPLLGRSFVQDLDKTDKNDSMRLVDHRTLQELIVGGVRYKLKS